MAALEEIKRIAAQAAEPLLRPTKVVDVLVEPDVGEDGDSLIRIRIVVPDADVDTLDFEQFFNATLEIRKTLRATGDERLALVGFITPQEIRQIADPES